MHNQLLGTTQPVLSISLEPGESIIAEVGGFAWMTDSIAMAAADDARREPRLCVYTATSEAGVVAFAAKLPGRILSVQVGPGYEGCLVRESSFLAGTPGVRIAAEGRPPGPRVPRRPGPGAVADRRLRTGLGRAPRRRGQARADRGPVAAGPSEAYRHVRCHGRRPGRGGPGHLRPRRHLSLCRAFRPGSGVAAVDALEPGTWPEAGP